MFTTVLQCIHDCNMTRSIQGIICGLLFILGTRRCVFINNNLQWQHLIGLELTAMIG